MNFVIVNDSGNFVEVIIEGHRDSIPKIMPAKDFDDGDEKEWQDVPQDRYEFDNENKLLKIKIAANEALRIEQMTDRENKEQYREFLNIDRIKIEGENGSVELKGDQVLDNFEAKKRSWVLFGPDTAAYVLRYK